MKKRIVTLLTILISFLLVFTVGCAHEEKATVKVSVNTDDKVEEMLKSMSTAKKLGQMMMIGISGATVDDDIRFMLHQYHIGGIILYDRNLQNAEQVKKLTADLQKSADGKTPLFISIDEEGGKVVRMTDIVPPPPAQSEIGASGDPQKAETSAKETAERLKALGVNLNFAPVADVGANNSRYFSASADTVADFVRAAARGYEGSRMVYCLKHFPGLGKSTVDTHIDSTTVDAPKSVLLDEDVVPFEAIIEENDPTNYLIMVSHANYAAIDENNPASLSRAVQTDFLRDELHYDGVIITDDLEMGAVSKTNDFSDLGVKAVQAGADIVMVCHDYSHATAVYLGLLDAVEKGVISNERIDESARRILKVKAKVLQ